MITLSGVAASATRQDHRTVKPSVLMIPPAISQWHGMRWLRLASLLAAAWCVMVLSHETGHLLGGWLGGGRLQQADLRPWALPHSHFDPDPRPLLTLWAGPILGIVLPQIAAFLFNRPWGWLIAHFCWLANGCYLMAGWVDGGTHLDTTRLLAQGASPLQIITYGVLTIGWGYMRFRASCRALLAPPKP